MKMKIFALLFFIFPYSKKLDAQVLLDNTIDSVQISNGLKFITEQFKIRKRTDNLANIRNKYKDSSSIILAAKEKTTNKLGNIIIRQRNVSGVIKDYDLTFFDGQLTRIVIRNVKKKAFSKIQNGAIYLFLNGILIYKSEKDKELYNINNLISISYRYFQEAQKIIDDSN